MSSINSVRFTATAVKNLGKKGILPADEHGYRETILGALNVYNSAGEFYSAEGVRHLFESSSLLQKRISRNRLRCELGHPKKMPGESDQAFINRIFMINEERVCGHIKEVYLDDNRIKSENGTPIIAIVGKVAPSGPFADTLERSFNNPNENVCFSVRGFTDDVRVRGITNRYLKTIITWDNVNDPGISFAEKWYSPSLETIDSQLFTRRQIERSVQEAKLAGVSQESAQMNIHELFASMGWSIDHSGKGKPAFMNW